MKMDYSDDVLLYITILWWFCVYLTVSVNIRRSFSVMEQEMKDHMTSFFHAILISV